MIRLRQVHLDVLTPLVLQTYIDQVGAELRRRLPERLEHLTSSELESHLKESVERLREAGIEHEFELTQTLAILALTDWNADRTIGWVADHVHGDGGDDVERIRELILAARRYEIEDLESADFYAEDGMN